MENPEAWPIVVDPTDKQSAIVLSGGFRDHQIEIANESMVGLQEPGNRLR